MSARVRRQAVYPAGPLNRAREGGSGAPTRPRERRNVGDTQKHAAGGGKSKEAAALASAGSHPSEVEVE